MQNTELSKLLSYALRHRPEELGLTLTAQGWVPVSNLLAALQARDASITLARLQVVVASNDKKRFAFSEDGQLIRASQGHSVAVELDLPLQVPPEILYHGTATRFLAAILEQGLRPGNRQHVHLSSDRPTAEAVGRRHGKPVVLLVKAGELHRAGGQFFRSANGVWLTAAVPVPYLVAEPGPVEAV
ncbi:RNA 2'-phosphotransferase [Hymenobacter metallilatus]|uniref:Probable RNA 2'-phosphotransferase n=1 Tax=Hymenobacter metallilatus TaxID=2493666 RepID=A0A3R9MJR6_9BACT|nr:RNA 2'-phosphotransferase [Hymenobacter metallilatus]RSK33291.1 RNA 2'-phosphotransferase [Hymenobacter metallilatus]